MYHERISNTKQKHPMCDNPFQVSCRWLYKHINIGMSIQMICCLCAKKKSCHRFLLPNRLIFWFNGSFGLESIDLQVKLSMFSEFWVHINVEVWIKDILYWLIGGRTCWQLFATPKWVRSQWINIECSMFKPPHQVWSCTDLLKHGKFWMQSNQHWTKAPGWIKW